MHDSARSASPIFACLLIESYIELGILILVIELELFMWQIINLVLLSKPNRQSLFHFRPTLYNQAISLSSDPPILFSFSLQIYQVLQVVQNWRQLQLRLPPAGHKYETVYM